MLRNEIQEKTGLTRKAIEYYEEKLMSFQKGRCYKSMTVEQGFEENSKVFKWGFKAYYTLCKRGFGVKSYIMLDFARTSKDINNLFEDLYSLDFFFLQLQQLTGVRLYEQESVIIFDEVQLLPKARQAIKYLVEDGRYKYIETGSLLSIRKNTKDYKWENGINYISVYMVPFLQKHYILMMRY